MFPRRLLAVLSVLALATSHCTPVTTASYWRGAQADDDNTNGTPFKSRPAIILLGDSITQDAMLPSIDGYGARLQEAYVRSVDVVGRGLTVYNTEQFIKAALPVVKKEISSVFNTVLITVWFGTNDATVETGPCGHQHLPVDKYRQNLITIAQELRAAAPQAHILMLTPNVIDDSIRTGGDRTNQQAGIYAAACREAAEGLEGVTLLDIYDYIMKHYPTEMDRGLLLRDGIHPNSEGNRVIYELIKAKAEELLPWGMLRTPQIPEWNP